MAAKAAGLPHVRVGFLEDALYDDGTPVAMVAAIQNFGAPSRGIPPRPFFSNMIAKHRDDWGPGLGGILAANGYDIPKALDGLGQVMAGQLAQAIVDLNAPALSATTLMIRKMKQQNPALRDMMSYKVVIEARARVAAGKSYAGVSIKPLVDTGIMLSKIGWDVVIP